MKHLKLFFALFAMLALGVGNAWAETFTRISSASDLADGDEIIFVDQAGEYACGTTQQTNNRTLVAIETNDNSYSYQSSDNVQVFVVKKNGTNYGFHTGAGYIYSANSSKNYLKTNTTASTTSPTGTSAWTLSVSGNVFTVTNVTNNSYYLALNLSNNPKLFSQYKSGQSKPCIYKKQSSSTPPTTASLVQIEKTAGKTEFVEGEAFEKATITATYDDETTKDVTSLATFSEPNMTQIGEQTVYVSYTDGEVTAETSYTINITEKPKYTVTWKVNGEDYTTTQVAEGNKPTFPTTPESCDATSTTFYGWATEAWSGKLNDISDKTIYTSASAMPAEAATYHAVFCEGSGSTTLINEKFDDNSNADSSSAFNSSAFSNFSGATEKAYKSKYGGVKFGTGSVAGYITSKSLDLSIPFTVTLDACKYGSDAGNIVVTVGSQSKTIANNTLGAAGIFNTYTLEFDAATATSTVKIATSQNRAYIDNVIIATKGAATNFVTTCQAAPEPAVLVSIAANAEGKNEFTEGDEFVKATITATYDDATTKDVTSLATFTGYDMNTTGTQTVTVTYEDQTITYNITVNPKPKYTITWNNAGTTNTTEVVQGGALVTLPEPADCLSGKKFMGWTAATEVNSDGSGIVYVKETDIPTSDMTYYAVFAVVEGGEGTPTTATVSIANYADAKSWADKQQYLGITVDENITATATGGGNTGKYYTNGENWRFYQNESATLTISAVASYEIQTVKVTYTVDNTGVLTLEGSNVASETTCEINAASVTFGVGNTSSATNGQVRISAIEVVYAPAAKTSDYSLDCTIHTEPTWTISKDAIDFADKYVGVSYAETFTISASNLTDDIALAIDGSNFTVSPTSISKDATFPQTVTVTYTPTAVSTHNATLNITSGSTLSKSIALTGSATEATIYTLTALADIKPTDKVIIVGTSGSNTYAMSNDKETSDAPAAVAVTVVDDKIATNETNILWNIAKNGDNLTIYPADQTAKWLYCLADANDGVRVGTGNAKEFTIDKGYLYTTQTTTPRHIGIYSNSDWRCYKPSADAIHTNIKDQSFAFYVLPDTDPSISVTPASKDFGAVASGETATQEFEITTMNLTQALSAELTGEGFTKSNIVDNKITITFAPTEEKDYSATLTISAGTEAAASVTISGKGAAATYTVTYNSNGATGEAPTDATKYIVGDKVTIAGQGDMTYAGYRFAGWKYGEDIYKAGAKFTMPAENVTFVAQWVEKEDFSTGYWVLVTDESELQSDDYVVIAAADYDVAMKSYETGNNCKQVEVTKVNNLLTWNENVGVFQLDKSGENYTFQDVNTEQYLYAAGGTSNNYLRAADEIPADENAKKYSWTISVADNKATIKAQIEDNGENKARNTIMYNATEGINGQLFSCYASGQKDIALYKYVDTYTYTRDVTNKYGTICLPYASASTSGAYFYEVVGKGTENGKPAIYLASVNSLKAGVPYIFEKTANTIKVVYSSEKVDAPQNDDANGLVGTFVETTVPDGDYILYNNAFCTNEPAGTLNKIKENRAYLHMDAVTGGAPQQMPGRRYIGMSVQGENEATGFENITAPAGKTVKAIVNGQLIIIRNGEMYNAQGQKL